MKRVKITSKIIERGLKIVFGIIISILIAEKAGLKFAASTGIVAMLGIQNTRKETIHTAVRRIVSFLYTILVAFAVHSYIGESIVDFTLVIFVITMITFCLEWQDTLSINIVVAVHLFLQHQVFSSLLIGNEAERVLIGMATAIVVNWHHPTSEEEFEKMLVQMEGQLATLLRTLAAYFDGRAGINEISSVMHSYDKTLEKMMERAYRYSNNHLSKDAIFYEQYMCMRVKEYGVIEEIENQIKTFHQLPSNAAMVGEYINEVSQTVSVRPPVENWMSSFERLQQNLKEEAMPQNYKELEDRAVIISVVREMSNMIQLKKEWIDGLSLEHWEG